MDDVKEVIRDLLDQAGEVRNRDVVAALDGEITRQGVHHHLSAMVASGELERIGLGRATRYQRAVLAQRSYDTAGLAEDQVWRDLAADVDVLGGLDEVAGGLVSYIFTEMVNNAIDHSESQTVVVRVREEDDYLVVDVDDRGVGIFTKVAGGMGTDSVLEAAQRLTQGKFTTAPDEHSGEGIFFSSRAAHVFVIEADGIRLVVDNERDDWSLGEVPPREGTLIRFFVDPSRARPIADVFREFTDEEFRFDRTTTVVRLFEAGTRFVSRSEARRLASGLEEFDRVVLDFEGVTDVGQGFADELFRVWAGAHPGKELEPVNMSEPVQFMVDRSRSPSR